MNWTLIYNNTENSCIFVVYNSLFPNSGNILWNFNSRSFMFTSKISSIKKYLWIHISYPNRQPLLGLLDY